MTEQFFATIAGALVALLGVLISLHISWKTHERNLREEREKLRDKREFDAKKTVLTSYAKAAAQFVGYVTRIVDGDLPPAGGMPHELEELTKKSPAIHFFADIDTIEKIIGFSRIATLAFVNVLRAKSEVLKCSAQIEPLKAEILRLETHVAWLKHGISSLLTSSPQGARILSYETELRDCTLRLNELRAEIDAAEIKKRNATEACREVHHAELPAILTAQMEMLLQCRKELGFKVDEDRYRSLMKSNAAEAQRALRAFTIGIREDAASSR